jgi:phosphoesterase RecJ-like protein
MTTSTVGLISRIIDRSRSFLICGHDDVDGDCIGSELALYHWLSNRGKNVLVVSGGPTLENYGFLPGYDKVCRNVPAGFTADVTLCVDTASRERVLDGVDLQGRVVNIDHHHGNSEFGDVNWIDPEAAAVGEMLFVLVGGDSEPLGRDVAACLYVAILTDTGSFQYTKTSARTFEIAAALVRAGADPHQLASGYYDNVHPDAARQTGAVLSDLHFELGGRLVWSEITRETSERFGGPARQPEQLASQLRSIRGVDVAVLFHQQANASGRASLRSRGRIDVSAIARELGGGGHPSAAGCRFEGSYTAGRDRLLDVVRRYIAQPVPPDSQ